MFRSSFNTVTARNEKCGFYQRGKLSIMRWYGGAESFFHDELSDNRTFAHALRTGRVCGSGWLTDALRGLVFRDSGQIE